MAEESRREGLPTWATVTISVSGIVATLMAAIAASLITGHQQGKQQDKNLAAQATLQDSNLVAQATAADRKELRAVVDEADTALLQAGTAAEDYMDARFSRRATPQAADVATRRLTRTQATEARLTIRLGRQHPITRAYDTARTSLQVIVSCGAGPVIYNNPDAIFTVEHHYNQARAYFDDSATSLLGVQVGAAKPHAAPSSREIEALAAAVQKINHGPCE